jgi:D-sedoheptulose 7-phosphate isomerase
MSSGEALRVDVLGDRLRESIAMCEQLLADEHVGEVVDNVVDAIAEAIRDGGKVLLCGNGGSAAEADHLAAELIGRFCLERNPYPAVSLASNVAALTAIANDYDYADVYARAVTGLGSSGDVVMGFSTSGRSANVIAALNAGRDGGMVTVALTGPAGSPMHAVADHVLCVPGERTSGIQEGHLLLGHVIFERVEQELCRA